MDKDLTKRMVADVVSTPGWKTVAYTAADIDRLVETARLPLVVKPVASRLLHRCIHRPHGGGAAPVPH